MKQLRLFPETMEEKCMRMCDEMKSSIDRQRKSQFAKIGEQKKSLDAIRDDFDIIKKGICDSYLYERRAQEEYSNEMRLLREEIRMLRAEIKNTNCEYLEFAVN